MAAFETHGVVGWSETDASGRFHYTSAMIWAENAEHSLYRDIMPDIDLSAFPRRAIDASYHRPLMPRDEYRVSLAVEKLGHTSLTLKWRVFSDGKLAADGRTVCVHLDREGRPASLPAALRAGLEGYLDTAP